MKKNLFRGYSILGIFFLCYSIIVLAIPFEKNIIFWLSYLFTAISFALLVYVVYLNAQKGQTLKSRFYGFPILKIGAAYTGAQIILSIVLMALAKIVNAWIPVVIYVLLLGISGVGLIAVDAVRDEIQRQDTVHLKSIDTMKSMQAKAAKLCYMTSDSTTKNELSKLSEAFRFSDPVSSDELEEIEHELNELLDEILKALSDEDISAALKLCAQTLDKLSERNQLCKLGKAHHH